MQRAGFLEVAFVEGVKRNTVDTLAKNIAQLWIKQQGGSRGSFMRNEENTLTKTREQLMSKKNFFLLTFNFLPKHKLYSVALNIAYAWAES